MKTKAATEAAAIESGAKIHILFHNTKRCINFFWERPKTMLQVSIETGILRANICRYIAAMEDKGLIQVIRKGYCPYTKFRAGFYSTDEALFTKPDVSQLNLFDYGRI